MEQSMKYKIAVVSLLITIACGVFGAFITIDKKITELQSMVTEVQNTQDAIYKEMSSLEQEVSSMTSFDELSKAIIQTLKSVK